MQPEAAPRGIDNPGIVQHDEENIEIDPAQSSVQ